MGTTSETKPKRYISVGLLAHVDSGKTTLSEGILYLTGQIRKPGRVDHGDVFLDNYALERQRGITIFSKQAVFQLGDSQVTLLDTPGHVDFSAEMERTLQVLDYAVLVVSGADGVQGHTRTLWNLLARYRIPTFIFVNKMDQPGTDKVLILKELKKKLDASCVDMEDPEDIATGGRTCTGRVSGSGRSFYRYHKPDDCRSSDFPLLFWSCAEITRCTGITGRDWKICGR